MLRHAEAAMGTVFSFAVRDAEPGRPGILGPALAELHRLDALFSPTCRTASSAGWPAAS